MSKHKFTEDSYEQALIALFRDELGYEYSFSAVAAAVAARAIDLSKITADQAAFAAQKDLPNGKKTMKAYLWSLEKAAYDAEHNG